MSNYSSPVMRTLSPHSKSSMSSPDYHPSKKSNVRPPSFFRNYYWFYRRWRRLAIFVTVMASVLVLFGSQFLFPSTTVSTPSSSSYYSTTLKSSLISGQTRFKSLLDKARHAIITNDQAKEDGTPRQVPIEDRNVIPPNAHLPNTPVDTVQPKEPIPPLISLNQSNNATALLVAIPTSHSSTEYEYRQTIRSTWGSLLKKAQHTTANAGNITAHLLFFIGTKDLDPNLIRELVAENKQTNDLILINEYKESYEGLSAKMLILHRWISDNYTTNWPNLKYIFKTDTDVWFDVDAVMGLVGKYYDASKTMIGYKYVNNVRLTHGKWANPEYSAPVYPQYHAGAGYLMSLDISLWVARNDRDGGWLKPLPNEDAVLGIWLAGSTVNWIHSSKFKPLVDPRQPNKINRLAKWVCKDGDILFHHLSSKGISNLHHWFLLCGSPCEATCLKLAGKRNMVKPVS